MDFWKVIWGADLATMQLTTKFNKGFRFLLCAIDIFSKYTWVFLEKIKKVLVFLMLFEKYQISQDVNLTKYELIKEVNVTIIVLRIG